MRLRKGLPRLALVCGIFAATLALLLYLNLGDTTRQPADDEFAGIRLNLTAEARESLQRSGNAFPANSAGFSAYYRFGPKNNHSLNKGRVDDHVFSPVRSGEKTLREKQATVISMGANYTVATLPLLNVENLRSSVNLYYDDQGWIVAYLPANAPSSQIWQALNLNKDSDTPFETIDHILLNAINIVISEALRDDEIGKEVLNYYHWQHEDAKSFLMMASVRKYEGTQPIAFTIPQSFDVAEVSATMWVAVKGVDGIVPCAVMALDEKNLLTKQCARGLYHETVDLYQMGRNAAHNFTLTQSESDQGASGALLMLVYSAP